MFVPTPLAAPPVSIRTEFFYNKFTKLDGSMQFVVGEGVYSAVEELELAHPAPHPSEPAANPNPLTPQAAVLSSGMHLSMVSLKERSAMTRIGSGLEQIPGSPSIEQDGEEEGGPLSQSQAIDMPARTPTMADFAPLSPQLTTTTGGSSVFDINGRRKKRNGTSANGTSSTFVSRAITDPNITARLAERNAEDYFIFTNVSRCLSWLDMGAPEPTRHEALSRLLFAVSNVTCHDVNLMTKSPKNIDLVIGTNTGDICWYEPMQTKYLRFNKQRCINPTGVTHVAWIPGSEALFMASHADGALVIYDRDREDAEFITALSNVTTNAQQNGGVASPLTEGEDIMSMIREQSNPAMHVLKTSTGPITKSNPVAYLQLSRQAITHFAISPDNQYVAVVGDDGCLKIVDFRQEKLLDVYSSYYGGFSCVAWSPDGAYIVTGGKDDLVTIWSFVERRCVARCHGHSSFVTAVAFDPWRCDASNYRIGSVGDDGKLCLWDFALASLHRPSAKARNAHVATADSAHRPRVATDKSTRLIHGTLYHEPESRLTTAILSPVAVKKVDDQPPSHLIFLEDAIVIGTHGRKYGRVRVWRRPSGRDLPVRL